MTGCADPLVLARAPATAVALSNLPYPPFDVVSAPELARVLGVSPRTLNDWRWLGREGQPPWESLGQHVGRAYAYRVDALNDWAASQGRIRPVADLWPYGADWLERQRLGRPASREETNSQISFLLEHGIISLRRRVARGRLPRLYE